MSNSDIKYLTNLSGLLGSIQGSIQAAECIGKKPSLSLDQMKSVERALSAYARIIEITTFEPYDETLMAQKEGQG